MKLSKQQLKNLTLTNSLFAPTTLKEAIERMQFVQIDPIRSPARAQDLTLRHRVKDYHVGDIDRAYCDLRLEEDFLFAHGYITRESWLLLHPRNEIDLTKADKSVYDKVCELGAIHPKNLEQHFGKGREINWWSGYSRASKMSLERLHYYGLLRVAKRENGFRIYEPTIISEPTLPASERLKSLVMLTVRIMAPVTAKTLAQSFHRIHRQHGDTRPILKQLVASGELTKETIDGLVYYYPTGELKEEEVPSTVKFLTPFDPVVRDRYRFEHLWGWLYQFEAYTPAPKRIRGYYAMPLLWQEDIIGWANVKVVSNALNVDLGFVKFRPKSKQFEKELEAETMRMGEFLGLAS